MGRPVGTPQSPEVRRRISEAKRESWATREPCETTVQRWSDAARARWEQPGYRERRRESVQAAWARKRANVGQ